MIMTLNEVVRESMNKCADILGKEYSESVRPIYGSTEYGSPYHIGSCVLIEINNTPYLITAEHVRTEHNETTTLYVGGENELIQIEGDVIITKDDKLDIAILPLSKAIIEKLGAVTFISESSILNRNLNNMGGTCLALGYPNSKNKKIHTIDIKVKPEPLSYIGKLNTTIEKFIENKANENIHYLLDYGEYSKDESGSKVKSVKPIGMSGGGLFFIQGMKNPENYRPNVKYTGKLIGILIKHHKNKEVVMATQLSEVIENIKKAS